MMKEEFRQKLSRDAQRKDKEDLLSTLDSHKVKYEIFWEGDKTAQDELSKFPITSYGVLDLAKLQDTLELETNQLGRLIKDENLDNPEVFVVWAFGPSLDLKTSLKGVLKNVETLVLDDDFFVVCPSEKWALMFHHDEKILFGRLQLKIINPPD